MYTQTPASPEKNASTAAGMSPQSMASTSLTLAALLSSIAATPRSVSDLMRRPIDWRILREAGMIDTYSLPSPNFGVLQFPEQLDRLVLGAAKGFLHFPDGVDDIHPPLLVQPAVLDRQAHAVQQNAVQCPGIGGELPKTAVLEQCFRDAEVGEQLARLTIKVVQRHLV